MNSAPVEAGKAGSWSSLAVLLTGNFITILDLFIVNVALPDIQSDLQASDAQLQLVIVAYSIPYGAMLLNAARLGDLYGRRRLFLVGMATFALGSLLCALAWSAWALIWARGVQGIGAALLMPQVYTSLRLLFEGNDRRKALAIMGAVQGIAGAASQVLGGYLITVDIGDLGWRLIFLVNLPLAAYALVAGRWMIVETRASMPAKLDIWGAIMGTSGLILILLPLMLGRDHHWPWWSILGPLISLPVFANFTFYEIRLARRGDVPIIDMSLFRNEGFILGILASFLFFSTISSFSLSLTILLQIGLGQTALEAGTLFIPSAVAFFGGSLLSTSLAKKRSHGALLLGMTICASGFLASVLAGGQCLSLLVVSLILNGLGQGIVIPLLLDMILSTVSDDEAGMASGAFSTMQVVGSAFGVTIVGVILFSMLESLAGESVPVLSRTATYGDAFATATIYNLAAIVLGQSLFVLWLRKLRKHR